MAATYPAAIWTPTIKTDKVDLVLAEHINRAQEEIVAAQLELGPNVRGSAADLVTRLSKILSLTGALRNDTSFPGTTEKALLFFRSDQDTIYIRNNADTQFITIGTAGTSGFLLNNYSSGHGGTITWGTEVYDIGSNTTATTFTAPVTGKYLLVFSFDYIPDGGAGEADVVGTIVTSNRNYTASGTMDRSNPEGTRHVTVVAIADMDAGDTAHCTTNLAEAAGDINYTNEYFNGIRIG